MLDYLKGNLLIMYRKKTVMKMWNAVLSINIKGKDWASMQKDIFIIFREVLRFTVPVFMFIEIQIFMCKLWVPPVKVYDLQ